MTKVLPYAVFLHYIQEEEYVEGRLNPRSQNDIGTFSSYNEVSVEDLSGSISKWAQSIVPWQTIELDYSEPVPGMLPNTRIVTSQSKLI
jgi:hypothetical protein